MLFISLESDDNTIISIDATFNFRKKQDWFKRDDVRRVIKNIDLTDVIDGECLRSPVLGVISPERLSTGCKAVILMIMYPQYKIYATKCGDNCSDDILKISSHEDRTIVLRHIMEFKEPFIATIVESGKVVHNMKEFIDEFYKYRNNR